MKHTTTVSICAPHSTFPAQQLPAKVTEDAAQPTTCVFAQSISDPRDESRWIRSVSTLGTCLPYGRTCSCRIPGRITLDQGRVHPGHVFAIWPNVLLTNPRENHVGSGVCPPWARVCHMAERAPVRSQGESRWIRGVSTLGTCLPYGRTCSCQIPGRITLDQGRVHPGHVYAIWPNVLLSDPRENHVGSGACPPWARVCHMAERAPVRSQGESRWIRGVSTLGTCLPYGRTCSCRIPGRITLDQGRVHPGHVFAIWPNMLLSDPMENHDGSEACPPWARVCHMAERAPVGSARDGAHAEGHDAVGAKTGVEREDNNV